MPLPSHSLNYPTEGGRGPSLCIAVIGATGELAKGEIFQALFALYYNGFLSEVRFTLMSIPNVSLCTFRFFVNVSGKFGMWIYFNHKGKVEIHELAKLACLQYVVFISLYTGFLLCLLLV